jgi:hypothetical protein
VAVGTAAREVSVLLPSTVLRLLCSRSSATTSLLFALSCGVEVLMK